MDCPTCVRYTGDKPTLLIRLFSLLLLRWFRSEAGSALPEGSYVKVILLFLLLYLSVGLMGAKIMNYLILCSTMMQKKPNNILFHQLLFIFFIFEPPYQED